MSNVLDVKLKSNVVTHLTGILRYLSIVLDFKLSIQCCNTPDILRYLYWYNRFLGHASYVPTGGHHQIPSLLTSVCNQTNCILQPDDQIINIQPLTLFGHCNAKKCSFLYCSCSSIKRGYYIYKDYCFSVSIKIDVRCVSLYGQKVLITIA